MKKLLMICLMSSLTTLSFGQGTNFGIKGAYSISSYTGNDWSSTVGPGSVLGSNPTYSSRTFFSGALAVNSEILEFLWLKHEFWYIQRGTLVTGGLGDTYNYQRHYLDLAPIMVAGNLAGFQVFAGPQAGVLLFKNDKYKVGNLETTYDDSSDDTVLDYGFIVGSEYEFPFGLNIGVRYIQGMNKLNPDNNQSWYNKTILISTGWTFGTGD